MLKLLRTIATYVPSNLARAVLAADAPTPPVDCDSGRFQAAVMYADVSGFTPLTEALSQKGAEGPEELTRLLNRYFSWMIAFIEAEGGEVVKFGGDALTVVFRADDEPLAHATRRAMQAAETMQSSMDEFGIMESSVGLITLRMKIGIGAGEVIAAQVGGVSNRWEYLIAGAALTQAGQSERQAKQGQINLSAEAQAVIWPHVLPSRPLPRLDWSVVKNPAAVETVLRHYVPKPVNTWINQELHDWLATLRPMSVLFAGLRGLDYSRPETIACLHQFVVSAQKIIYNYQGTLPRLTVDDKGTVMLILFGAPPHSHEDDPERAVRCALELQQMASRQGMQLACGVTTGRVFAGPVGGFTRREYTVMGDAVNLAARLMVITEPGQVSCNYEVFRSTYGRLEYQTLPAIQVKGKTEPIRIYRPTGDYRLGQQFDSLWLAGTVGRQAELQRLAINLEAARGGRSRIVIIEGEAGIGKTHLVKELVQLAKTQNLAVLWGAGRSIDQITPFRMWHDILAHHLLPGGGPDVVLFSLVEAKIRQLDPYLLDYLFLLNDVLGSNLPPGALAALFDDATRYQMMAAIVLTLLDAGNLNQPLTLILEDAQWLDGHSWNLAVQLALTVVNNRLPVLLALVTRPVEDYTMRADLAVLANLPQTERLRLDTLSPDETLALVAAPLGLTGNELPEAVAELIRNRAGGNPFFAEENFYFLHQNGLITFKAMQDKPRCLVNGELDRLAQALPATIQNVILARIDRLPPEKQLMLKVAAVIGQLFPYTILRDTLRQHLDITESQIKADLDDLTYLGFIIPQTGNAESVFRFKHIIFREVAYQTLLFDRRRQLHRTVAQWYEDMRAAPLDRRLATTNPENDPNLMMLTRSLPPASTPLSPQYALLVYHWHQAEDEAKEREYAALVGEQAVAQFANAEALGYLNRALDLTPPDDVEARYKLLLARETVLNRRGDRERQALDLKRLTQLADSTQKSDWQAEAALRRSALSTSFGDVDKAFNEVQQAITSAQQAANSALECAGLLRWAMLLAKTGRYAEARGKVSQALNLAASGEVAALKIEALLSRAVIGSFTGDYNQAQADCREARLIAQIHNQKLHLADCYNLQGQLELQMDNFLAATESFEQAMVLYYTVGYKYGENLVLYHLGLLHLSRGEFEPARDCLEQVLDAAHELNDREIAAQTLGSLGELYGWVGEYTTAQGYLGQALGIQKELGHQFGEAEILNKLSWIYYNVGDNRTCKRYCELALAIEQKIGTTPTQNYTQIYLGHALAGLGMLSEAQTAYQTALADCRALNQPARSILAQAGLANVALRLNNLEQAGALAREVVVWIEANGLAGIHDPGWVLLTLHDVFEAVQQPTRARQVIDRAYHLLQERANHLTNKHMRHKFLDHVKTHQDIIAIWEGKEPQPLSASQRRGSTKETFHG